MITIFTPIYNRADTIEQLYQSLRRQTCDDFEWLIIDDGSQDDIEEVINGFCAEKPPFALRFYRQENGGKHRAVNRGVQLARGDAFFIVDSDDYLADDAVRLVREWWKDIADRDQFAGVSGLKVRTDMSVVGDMPPTDGYIDATNLEREKYRLNGDKAEVYKTAVLRKYPFPEFVGERFLTENVVWDRIANDGYLIRWYNEATYICEYREDGLTRAGIEKFCASPGGWGLYIRQSRQFGRSDEKKDYHDKLTYFEMLHTRLTEEEIMGNLGIDEPELDRIKRYIKNTLEQIGSRIAVYGLGRRGKRLLRLYQETPVRIEYVMDENVKDMEHKQVGPEEELPEADAIIVTPKDGQTDILHALSKRTGNRLMGYDEWEKLVFPQ